MKYAIGTGYFNKKGKPMENFHRLWYENTLRYSQPKSIYTIASAGSIPPDDTAYPGKWIVVSGDVGDIHMLIDGTLPYAFCGWTMTVITLALIAYQDECDFIFKEQDCLAFGPWVERIYQQIGQSSVIFGNCRTMLCAQSLFMVRHDFIPEFVRMILEFKHERAKDRTGEHKFDKFEQNNPKHFCRFDFGYDRDRPFNVNDDVFYVQQLTGAELGILKQAGLINTTLEDADCVFTTHK